MIIMKDKDVLPGHPYEITVSLDGASKRRQHGVVHGLSKVKMVDLSSEWLQACHKSQKELVVYTSATCCQKVAV
jgi:hypothetical protein